uniref:Secreted protein n=1 Tax=Steinernema glaseri TaxID=37863 RepID=A0A1I7ZBL7_9BILA
MPSVQTLAVAAFACCLIAALVGSTPIPIEGSGEGSGEQQDGSGEASGETIGVGSRRFIVETGVDGSGQLPQSSGEEFLDAGFSKASSDAVVLHQESSGESSGLEGSGETTHESSGDGSGEAVFF